MVLTTMGFAKHVAKERWSSFRLTFTALTEPEVADCRCLFYTPTVTERDRRLEDAGVITDYRLDLDPAAFGLPFAA